MAHWRELSGPFATYLEQPYPGIPRNRPQRPRLSADVFSDENRKPARSLLHDILELVIEPFFQWAVTVVIYYLAVWDDIMFTWDWGPYRGFDDEWSKIHFRQYTKGDDDEDEMFAWEDRDKYSY